MAEYLKPNSDVTKALSTSAGTDHYVLVDDAENDTHDSNSTYVACINTATYQADEYGLENLDATSGTYSLQIRAAAYCASASNPIGKIKLGVKVGSTVYYASEQTLGKSYSWFSDTWANNPATSEPWTVSEINSAVAVLAIFSDSKSVAYCTCLYAVVEAAAAEPVYSKVMGVAKASISKVMGTARAAISKISGKS